MTTRLFQAASLTHDISGHPVIPVSGVPQVDVPFKMVLDRLPFATCTVDEYVAVYRTLENTWTTAGPQIQKAFATSKLLRIGVQRYTSPEVVWSDPSALLSKTPVIEVCPGAVDRVR